MHTEYGPEAARKGVFPGMLFGSKRLAAPEERGGIDPRFKQGALPAPPHARGRAGELKETGVNLLSFTAFPSGGGKAQLTVVPEVPDT